MRHSQRIETIVTALDALLDVGAEVVPIATVMDMADPESRLRRDRNDHRADAQQPVIDPKADPITGCMPVTPQG